MRVRAALTTDLEERAVLQASANRLDRDIRHARAGIRPVIATAGFDGAAIVLASDDGTVTYHDGETAPLHCTLAYLGDAANLSSIQRRAAGNAATRVAANLDSFTPTVLSPARFG